MSARKQLAYLGAALTIGLGLLGLLNPLLTVRLFGLDVVQPRGLSEARALFGALFLVMGASMLWAITRGPRAAAYLRLPGMLMASMAVGRLLSILLDGVLTPANFGFLAVEILIATSALLGSVRSAATPSGSGVAEVPDTLAGPRGRRRG